MSFVREANFSATLDDLKRDLEHLRHTSIPSSCFKVGLRLEGQTACNTIECQEFEFSRYREKLEMLNISEKLEGILKSLFEDCLSVFETIERIVNRKKKFEKNLKLVDLKKQDYYKRFFNDYVSTLKML